MLLQGETVWDLRNSSSSRIKLIQEGIIPGSLHRASLPGFSFWVNQINLSVSIMAMIGDGLTFLTAGGAPRAVRREAIGTQVNTDDKSDRRHVILAVVIACITLVAIFVITRLLVRRLMTRQLFLDDGKSVLDFG
jgi:hypothetical protein